MKFILSLPPSINATYGVNRNQSQPVFKKQEVRDWEEKAGYEILSQTPPQLKEPLLGDIGMIVNFYSSGRDIDAGLKVLLDLFQRQRVYKNDNQVKELHVHLNDPLGEEKVEVELSEIS